MNRRRLDATSALLRGLEARLAGGTVNFMNIRSQSWASVTFTGARHEVTFALTGQDSEAIADRFVAGLNAAEFPLRDHFLADIAAVAREGTEQGVQLSIEALTVEDG